MSGLGCDRTHGHSGSAQIETNNWSKMSHFCGRSPQGECGLKWKLTFHPLVQAYGSLPARGVWIEIPMTPHETHGLTKSLPARGVWIEISPPRTWCDLATGRSPQGECGLKSAGRHELLAPAKSLPARGVWIEIRRKSDNIERSSRSPQGECGLKLTAFDQVDLTTERVAPRKGSVD